MNDELTEALESLVQLGIQIDLKIVTSLLIIAGVWIAQRIVSRVVAQRIHDVRYRYHWQKTTGYIAAIFGMLLIGIVWIESVQAFIAFMGLLSAGLAIALKDLIVEFVGWLFIIWRQPFLVGDRIQIGELAGDVIDIRIFQFTILEIGNWVDADQSTGRIIHIPNGRIFSEYLANYSRGLQYLWNEISVIITFESNWKKAKAILQKIVDIEAKEVSEAAARQLEKTSGKFLIFYKALTPTVYTRVEKYGISLTIRYLCEPRHRRGSTQEIWEAVLEEFAKCADIEFAYPTQRFYAHDREGKVERQPPF